MSVLNLKGDAVRALPLAYLSRRYRFSASHRLQVDHLSAAENKAMFGKCNNPFGHGHNYIAQFTFAGPIDPQTGMLTNLADVDEFATRELEPFRYANLNTLPCFESVVPSTENLCLELWARFRAFPHAELRRVRVEETGNNAFEYTGDGLPRSTPSVAALKGK